MNRRRRQSRLTRRTKKLLQSVLEDDDTPVTLVPDTQPSTSFVPDTPPPSGPTVIPETQETPPDLFNVTLVSEPDLADESSEVIDDCVNASATLPNTNNAPATSAGSLEEPLAPLDPPKSPQNPAPTVGTQIETIVGHRYVTPVTTSVHLFRGPKNPLSAFFHQKLSWKKMDFISAEQAYQHEKLVFHKVSRTNCNRLLKCRSSHDVKRIANQLVPKPCNSWDKVKFSLMTEITKSSTTSASDFEIP